MLLPTHLLFDRVCFEFRSANRRYLHNLSRCGTTGGVPAKRPIDQVCEGANQLFVPLPFSPVLVSNDCYKLRVGISGNWAIENL